MTTYLIRITDQNGQPSRTYPANGKTLLGAKREAGRFARKGFIGGSAEVLVKVDVVDQDGADDQIYECVFTARR